ncbi:ATP-binding protein [Nocardia sp. JW2]|uniref:ATP-binding protein n=1 Tax=Nocardia sp. JW2 TaxID=3450738 RepID=UPI003F423E86
MITELIGREWELADLLARLDDAVHAVPQQVICTGEAGVGKTRLVAELAARARERGVRTLWARALELPDPPPFWLWRQALGPGIAAPDGDRVALFEAFAASLDDGAATGTLLVIDDIHWADEPSLQALLYVVRGLRDRRVMVCATERTGAEDGGWTAIKPELLREPVTASLPVRGLSPADSARCLQLEAGRALPAELADRAFDMTGGNPFYLRELGRSMRGSTDDALHLPTSLREVVRARMAPRSHRAAELLRAASILGERFSIAVAARLVERSAADCLAAVDEAVDAGLLAPDDDPGTVRFAHALVRAALLDDLSLHQRVVLHQRAALAIEGLYPDAVEANSAALAWHWANAAVTGAHEPAVRWARRAAQVALRELAFEDAVRFYGLAVTHAAELDSLERGRLLLGRAAAQVRAGHLAAARADCAAAEALARKTGEPVLQAEAALVLEPIGERGWDRDIADACAEALAAADLPVSLRARLLARSTETAIYLGRSHGVDASSRVALAVAERSDDPAVLAAALRARQLACSGPDHRDEHLELATRMIAAGEDARDPAMEMWGRLWRIDALWEQGDLGAITGELSCLSWCTEHTGGPMARWHRLVAEAALAQARAEFDDALDRARRAHELATTLGHPAAFGAYRSLLVVVGHHRGHPPEALAMPQAPVRGEVRNLLFAALGTAFPMVDSGMTAAAESLYRGLGRPGTWVVPAYFALDVLAVGGAVAAGLGIVDDVAYFRERLSRYRNGHVTGGGGNAHYLGPVELWLGKFAAALDDPDTAEKDLRAAARTARTIGAPGFAVEADCELAELLLARGAIAEAVTVAEGALPVAESAGMTPWIERLRMVVARENGGTTLTPREREVARLVARGLTNREIATALVLSERTAQNHVQHILTKLGFTSRSRIASWVGSGRIDQ